MSLHSSWLSPKLEVRQSSIDLRGVFANAAITKNERVAVFGGEIMPIDEIEDLPEEFQEYTMQIEERFVIGNRRHDKAEDTDFFNHSCEPNCGFKGQIFLVAMRNIKKGEEITFDYAMVVSESKESKVVFSMECLCGTKSCRKSITENDWKLPELRRKYNGYFSQYLQEKIDAEISL